MGPLFQFSFVFSDSPVLWIRVDPDMQLIRSIEILQPDFQWQYQLRHERDVTAQTEAVRALERFPTPQTRKALTDIIENESCFYKVRYVAITFGLFPWVGAKTPKHLVEQPKTPKINPTAELF